MSPSGTQDLWPRWMWVAVPVLVVVVVAGLWWAIFSGDGAETAAEPTATATMRPLSTQPTQAPTTVPTLPPLAPSPTSASVLPTVAAPTSSGVATPTARPTAQGGMAVGDSVKVSGTNGVLNMRDGAGTGYQVIGSLREGTVVEIVGGPKSGNGYTWWQVRTDTGTVGWAAGDWLKKE